MKRSPVPPNLYPPLTPRTRTAPGIKPLVNPPILIEYFKLKTFYDGWGKKFRPSEVHFIVLVFLFLNSLRFIVLSPN